MKVQVTNELVRQLRWPEWAMLVGVLLHAVWPMLWGEGTLLPIHDNLDANHPTFYRIAHSPQAFAGPTEPFTAMMGGSVLRGSVQSDLSLLFWVYRLSPSHVVAYQVHHFVTVLVAFASMFVLLRLLLPQPAGLRWAVSLGAAFAWVPFFPAFSLGIAALPAVAWAFARLSGSPTRAQSLLALALLVGYALSAPMYYTTAFAALAGGVYALVLMVRRRRVPVPLLTGVVLLGLVGLITEWRLLALVLEGELARSHRAAFDRGYHQFNFKGLTLAALDHWLWYNGNQAYDRVWAGYVGLLAMLSAAAIAWRGPAEARSAARIALILGGVAFVCAASEYVLAWDGLRPVLEPYRAMALARAFDLRRISVIVPVLWIMALAWAGLAISEWLLSRMNVPGRARIAALLPLITVLGLQLQLWPNHAAYVTYYASRLQHSECTASEQLKQQYSGVMTLAQFYAPGLWQQVIGQLPGAPESFRVGSVGLQPCIPLLYGLNTIDGYANVYTLAYKARFRRAIAPELDFDSRYREYFDTWGSRAVLYSSERFARDGHAYAVFASTAIRQLRLGPTALRELGLNYLISAHRISNAEAIELELVSVNHAPEYATTLFLYRLRR